VSGPPRTPLLKLFARNLREARKRAGLSQELLAEKADLHPTYIGLLEREQRSISLVYLERLARALKKEPWELLHPGRGIK
jgi:transcriptional regulator with XRE-family HTH domain